MIQIAILGLGTVGTGVAKVVAENASQIERKLGEPLQLKTVLVRHFKDGPYRQLMTDDFLQDRGRTMPSGWWWRPSAAWRRLRVHQAGAECRQACGHRQQAAGG